MDKYDSPPMSLLELFKQAQLKNLMAQSAAAGRWLGRDMHDYDVMGALNLGMRFDQGHAPDLFKKPNHPTFSIESMYSNATTPGGQWGEDSFTPSLWMLARKEWPIQRLREYFERVEPGYSINIPERKRKP
jgi:hypothetical protein